MEVMIKNGRIESITDNGTKIMDEFTGRFYEDLLDVQALRARIEEYEENNPLEKARRILRQYKEGTVPAVERCSCC